MEQNLVIKVVNKSQNPLPQYETKASAGLDVRADFSRVTPDNLIKLRGEGEFIWDKEKARNLLRIGKGARALIPTGLFIAIPEGYEAQARPRSGLALKQGLTVLNTPGTIDSDYRGEIGIILINLGTESAWIEDGERIAQLVFNKCERITWDSVDELDVTERTGGFGHTGVK